MRVGRVDVGQRSETVHRANLSAIVRGLHEQGPQSRSELVAATGLTRSAIRALVGELAAAGLVTEDDAVRLGTPGRPSPLVRLNATGAVVLSLEILVDSIAAAIVGLGGETLDHVRLERPRGELSVDDVVADLAALAADLRSRGDWPIIGIGVAVAGVVRRDDGRRLRSPRTSAGSTCRSARASRARSSVAVPISIVNDADAGVLGEHRRGAAVGVDNVLYVSGEVGVGGGLIVDGRLLTGAAGFAGEIGHVTVNPDGAPAAAARVAAGRPRSARACCSRWPAIRPTRAGPASTRSCARPPAGSGRDRAPSRTSAAGSASGSAGLVNILNPRLVILGGPNGRLYPLVARRHRRRAGPVCPAGPAGAGPRRPGDARRSTRRSSARPRWPSIPCSSDPAAWFGRRDRAFHLASA